MHRSLPRTCVLFLLMQHEGPHLTTTQVYYDFSKYGYDDTNFIVNDKNNWHMVAKITNDGLYRVSYAETPGMTREQYIERQPMRYVIPLHVLYFSCSDTVQQI
jgi:hypothetical protein